MAHQLISMILLGPNIHGAAYHAQPIKNSSQLKKEQKRTTRNYICRTEHPSKCWK